MADLDDRGLPTAMVLTTAFADAAQAQGTLLGFMPPLVFVPHPIQDRTDAELRGLADKTLDSILQAVTAPAGK